MPANLIKYLHLALFCLFGSTSVYAQTRLEPGTAKVPSQTEPAPEPGTAEQPAKDSDHSKIKPAHLRVWNFSGKSNQEALGVFTHTEKSAAEEPLIWLGRGLRYATMGRYVELPAGAYDFLITTESLENPDPEKPVKADQPGKPETKDIRVELTQNEYATLLLQELEGKIKATFIQDSKLPVDRHTVRVLNLTGIKPVGLYQVKNNVATVVFDPVPPGEWLSAELPGRGLVSMELCYKDAQDYPLRQSLEIDMKAARSTSLLVFYDRYGRVTAQGIPDAPYSAAQTAK